MEYGFIRDMMDVKILILYVAARCDYPLDQQQMYALCFQDDCVSYFDICTALVELEKSGHLQEVSKGKYVITDKGRQDGEVTADSISGMVRKKAALAVVRYNEEVSRSAYHGAQIIEGDTGEVSVRLSLRDDHKTLMTIDLAAESKNQAMAMARGFREKADVIYQLLLEDLLDE